jgi:hypothetical protein
LLSEAYGGEAMKKSSIFEWHKQFKESINVEITNEDSAHHFIWYQVYCSLWIHFTRPNSQTKLIMWKYWSGCVKLCVEKGLNFGPTIGFSTMTVLRLTRCSLSSSFWPRNWLMKWNSHFVLLIWLWMTSCCFQK